MFSFGRQKQFSKLLGLFYKIQNNVWKHGCCCCSVTQSRATLCDPMDCSTPGFPVLHYLLELDQAHVHWFGVMPSNHLVLCCPLLLLPSIFPSIRVFSNESALPIRWPKYWSFSFSISPSNEYSGLIFFRIDWFDLLAVQSTLKSFLQHHSLKASILWHSAFLIKYVFEDHYSVTGNILEKIENQLITASYIAFPYWKYV